MGIDLRLEAEDSAAYRRALRADCDPLTGLADRRAITARVGRLVADREDPEALAVCTVDLDRFRVVNDLLGHDAGDRVLVAGGERLARVAGRDNVGRLGADEFVVVCPGASEESAVIGFAQRLRAAVAAPLEVDGHQTGVSVSVGIALADADDDPSVLIQRASTAMYRGRADGRSVALADAAAAAAAIADLLLDEQLRAAIEADELTVAHQPIIAADGTVLGTEALVRWPGSGVGPGTIVEVAERAGLMPALGHAVASRALADLPGLSAAAGRPLNLSINWSAQQLTGESAAAGLADLLTAHDVAPERVCVELTESSAMLNATASVQTLNALRELGVAVSLDDFGTGYSSFAYLQDLPVDQVKLDRAMVRRSVQDHRGAQVLRGMVQMCRGLGLVVVGEGVETPAERRAVEQAGCHAWQGYLGARPASADELKPALVSLSTRSTTGHSGLSQAVADAGLVDALVLRHVEDDRWLQIGGAGRGEEWAGIVEVDLAEEPVLRRMLQRDGMAVACHDRPFQVLGPYWATAMAAVRLDDRLVVLGHPTEAVDIEVLEAVAPSLASLAVADVTQLAPSRSVAGLLDVLESVRTLLAAQDDDPADALRHLLDVAVQGLSCDIGFAWVPDVGVVTRGMELTVAQARAVAAMAPRHVQQAGPHDLPDRLVVTAGMHSWCALPLGGNGVLVLAHAGPAPRGFTTQCRRLSGSLSEAGGMVLAAARARQGAWQVADDLRA